MSNVVKHEMSRLRYLMITQYIVYLKYVFIIISKGTRLWSSFVTQIHIIFYLD